MEQDIGVVINNILFLDKDCQEEVEDKPFVWGEGRKPNSKKIKEDLLKAGFIAYKWPSEKDKIPPSIIGFPILKL